MSELKGELVETSDTYFGRANEQMSLFYPTLDMRVLDILKVIHDGQLVNYKEVSRSTQI